MEEHRSDDVPVPDARHAERIHTAVAAFEKVYLRFAPRLYRIAIRRFGIPPADAEEIVCSIFVVYLNHTDEVERLEPYFIGSLCDASRRYLRDAAASGMSSPESPS